MYIHTSNHITNRSWCNHNKQSSRRSSVHHVNVDSPMVDPRATAWGAHSCFAIPTVSRVCHGRSDEPWSWFGGRPGGLVGNADLLLDQDLLVPWSQRCVAVDGGWRFCCPAPAVDGWWLGHADKQPVELKSTLHEAPGQLVIDQHLGGHCRSILGR